MWASKNLCRRLPGEVKNPMLEEEDWSDLEKLEIPWDVLEQADLSTVKEQRETTGRFVIKRWGH